MSGKMNGISHPIAAEEPPISRAGTSLKTSWRGFWSLLLVMSVIQFTSAWLYPGSTFGGAETLILTKTMGVPFQYTLWLMVVVGAVMHVGDYGFDLLGKILAPWLPFFVVGLIASVFGIEPISSLRSLVLWSVMALAAASTGAQMQTSRSSPLLLWLLFTLLVLSCLLALLLPSIGTQTYGSGKVWRGVFTNKNQLGWIASLAMLICAGLFERRAWKLPAAGIILAIACLLASGSKGALVAVLITIFYAYLVTRLNRYVTSGLGIALVIVALICAAIFGLLVLPEVLALLGRDTTLTGRTTVWAMYFSSMMNTPWLGQGPGSFTAVSELTTPLAQRLGELGAIVTPHNAFLGAFGDGGIPGLLVFSGVLIYLAVILPFLRTDRLTRIGALIAFFMMAHGIVETHDIFAPGAGWYFLILIRGISLRQDAAPVIQAQAVAVPMPYPNFNGRYR